MTVDVYWWSVTVSGWSGRNWGLEGICNKYPLLRLLKGFNDRFVHYFIRQPILNNYGFHSHFKTNRRNGGIVNYSIRQPLLNNYGFHSHFKTNRRNGGIVNYSIRQPILNNYGFHFIIKTTRRNGGTVHSIYWFNYSNGVTVYFD
jgi:hypothetical protein